MMTTRHLLAFGVIAGMSAVQVSQASDDVIFNSGIEPGLAIEGRISYPEPLAGGTVQARFGDHVASSGSRPDGSYGLVLEYRYLDDVDIVELSARGQGNQAHVQWAGVLGPAERLVAAAGDDGVLDFAEETFVNLGPRSTAVTAAMRADNDYSAIEDAATFDRTVRAWQRYVSRLTEALTLAATGEIDLPGGADTTWQVLSSLALAQELVLAHDQVQQASDCDANPTAALCRIREELPGHPDVFPLHAPVPGRTYSPTDGYHYQGGQPPSAAVRFDGSQWLFQGRFGGAPLQPTPAGQQPDGSWLFERADGQPLYVSQSTAWVDGQQVLREIQTLRVRLRLSRGPGGLVEVAQGQDVRLHHPDNPEIPDEEFEYPLTQPTLDAGNALPVSQQLVTGAFADSRWLLTTPYPAVDDPIAVPDAVLADIHAFAGSGGSTERGGQALTVLDQDADGYRLAYGDIEVDVHLVNQDLPGVWRTRMLASGPDGERVINGIALEVDDPQPAWAAANVPGSYESRINGHTCDGPYLELEALLDVPTCPLPLTAFTFNPDGTGDQGGVPGLSWQLGTGADAGRLLIERTLPPPTGFFQARGWEVVKEVGDRLWLFENLNQAIDEQPPEPVQFVPSARVYPLRVK